jgi:hypothetical protein
MRKTHWPALALLWILAPACSGAGDGDDDDDDDRVDPYPDCGRTNTNAFFIRGLQLLIDPIDFAGESWDWDGGGLVDFQEEYDAYLAAAAALTGNGAQYATAELLLPLVESTTEMLASPYVSPDPILDIYRGDEVNLERMESWSYPEDQNLVWLNDVDVILGEDEYLALNVFDEDPAFDDPVGTEFFSAASLRTFCDCGPVVMVFSDVELARWDTRIRALALEVEPL